MLTDAQRDLLKTQPERFSSITLHIPEFAALDISSIFVDISHDGRYLVESDLTGKPVVDPHTPQGPIINLGLIKDIQDSLEDSTEFTQAVNTIFSVINDVATQAVRQLDVNVF